MRKLKNRKRRKLNKKMESQIQIRNGKSSKKYKTNVIFSVK